MIRRRKSNRGFVLLLVLVILAIAATVLASLTRANCDRALDAAGRRRSVQRRWALASLEQLLTDSAEMLLAAEETERERPVAHTSDALQLADLKIRYTLSDEQAKANVNHLAEASGMADVAMSIRELQAEAPRVLPVLLRPAKPDASLITPAPQIYSSYEQLFALQRPEQLLDLETGRQIAGWNITCWGSGRLHYKRSSRQVLRRRLAGLLNETQIETFVTFLAEHPDCTKSEALDAIDLGRLPRKKREQIRGELEDILTEASGCFALWLVADDGRRTWLRLTVRQDADDRIDKRTWRFTWGD
jgi:hypothetical protein